MPTSLDLSTNQGRFPADADLRRALAARLDATLAGRRPVAQILADCPQLTTLTLVIADLAAVANAWAARLGTHGEPPDPAQFDEPGLAQQFDLGSCTLILFQPAEGTAADIFLCTNGGGLYATSPALAPMQHARPFSPLPI